MILSDGKTDPGTTDQSGSTDYNRQYLQLQLHLICYFQDIHFSCCFYYIYIYEFSYKFDTVFLSISRDRNIRYNFHCLQSRAKASSFQPIPPFIFPLQSLYGGEMTW